MCVRVFVAHLEEVILMDHTTVGQVLDQPVGEGGFASVGYAAWKQSNEGNEWWQDAKENDEMFTESGSSM